MTYCITVMCPVYVYVDENDEGIKYVSKVVVDDEALNVSTGTVEAQDGEPCDEIDQAGILAAADECQEWPAWRFGS